MDKAKDNKAIFKWHGTGDRSDEILFTISGGRFVLAYDEDARLADGSRPANRELSINDAYHWFNLCGYRAEAKHVFEIVGESMLKEKELGQT